MAAVIRGRERCEEVDFVLDRRIVYMLKKAESPHARQYLIKFPEGKEEEIIVTLQSITFHDRKIDGAQNILDEMWPTKIYFNRFIVGRPNLIELPIMVTNTKIGAIDVETQRHVESLWLWTYDEKYPAAIEVDAMIIKPRLELSMGDLERMLPDGLYLHEAHRTDLNQPIVELLMNTEILEEDPEAEHSSDWEDMKENESPPAKKEGELLSEGPYHPRKFSTQDTNKKDVDSNGQPKKIKEALSSEDEHDIPLIVKKATGPAPTTSQKINVPISKEDEEIERQNIAILERRENQKKFMDSLKQKRIDARNAWELEKKEKIKAKEEEAARMEMEVEEKDEGEVKAKAKSKKKNIRTYDLIEREKKQKGLAKKKEEKEKAKLGKKEAGKDAGGAATEGAEGEEAKEEEVEEGPPKRSHFKEGSKNESSQKKCSRRILETK